MEPMTVRTKGSLTLVSDLGTPFLLLSCHVQYDSFVKSHYILFCHVQLLSLRILSFSNERW